MALGQYYVRVLDHDGVPVCVIDNYVFLEYQRNLNAPGWFELQLTADDDRISEIQLDYMVEVYRRAPEGSWELDFEGFVRRFRWWMDETGLEMFSAVGRGYEDLLDRRLVVPRLEYPPEAYAEYTDHFTDVMRELVRDHAGPGAAAGRRFPGLAVEADTHEGTIVTMRYRFNNLLERVQELSRLGADFAIVGTGPAEFEFRVYYPRRGLDRTLGNAEANPAVVFSVARGNMIGPEVVDSSLTLANVIYVAGQGWGDDREVREVEDSESIALSPWNRCEGYRDARHLPDESLEGEGYISLMERARELTLNFKAAEIPSCRYKEHWDLGDLVTAVHAGYTFSMRIVSVHVSASRYSGEEISPQFKQLWVDL